MPRVQERKARKDYPNNGIKKGDKYYYWKIKQARGGIVRRSLTYPKPSDLTLSPFLGQLGDIQQGFSDIDSVEGLNEVAEQVREMGQECQSSLDNMPEGLQQGDTGQLLEERVNGCEEWADAIEQAATDLEQALEELETTEQEWDAYDTACSEYEEMTEAEQAEAEEPVEPSEERPSDDARSELISEKVNEAESACPF